MEKVYCTCGLERNLSQEPEKYNFVVILLCVCCDNLLKGIYEVVEKNLCWCNFAGLQEIQVAKSMLTVLIVVMTILKRCKVFGKFFYKTVYPTVFSVLALS